MIPTSDITSFSDVRQNLREHFNRLKETGRPMYVTTNGETEAVMLSAKAFDALVEQAELLKRLADIDRGMGDVKTGRVTDYRAGLEAIAKKYGLSIEE